MHELFRPEGLEFQDYTLRYNPRTLGNPIDGAKGLPGVITLTRKRSKEFLFVNDYFWAGNINNADLTDERDRTDIAEFMAMVEKNNAHKLIIGPAIEFFDDRSGRIPSVQRKGVGIYPQNSINPGMLKNIRLDTRHSVLDTQQFQPFRVNPEVSHIGDLRVQIAYLDYRIGFRKVKSFRQRIEEIKGQLLPH